MKAVKVQYTVNPNFIEENKNNIKRVMEALRANPIEGMKYASFTDGSEDNTFVHINMAKDEETMSKLNDLEEFIEFRKALKASKPLKPPKQTTLMLVDAGFDLI